MNSKVTLLVVLIFLGQLLPVLSVKSDPDEIPPAAVVGRYILQEDKVWFAYNKTVQQLRDEGYDLQGDAGELLYVKYNRLQYTLQCIIVKLSWPNVTLQNTEGEYDLNVTAHRILEDSSIGEQVASFYRPDQPAKMGNRWNSWSPYLGVMYNPFELEVGKSFNIERQVHSVVRKETLKTTAWGKNETYVIEGVMANETYSISHISWCDVQSGIVLKEIYDTRASTFTHHEELILAETGVKFEASSEGVIHEIPLQTNSTINEFVFDASTKTMNITVSGTTGTSGTLELTIPRVLVPSGYSIEVYIDDQRRDYKLTEDSNNYYLSLEYQHSTHMITISFIANPFWTNWWFWVITIVLAAAVLTGLVYLQRRKSQSSKNAL